MTTSHEPAGGGVTVRFLPFDVAVDVAPGSTILDAAVKAGLPVRASCGGRGTCGHCIVRVAEGTVEPAAAGALPPSLAAHGYALSCVTRARGNLTVQLPRFEQRAIRAIAESKFFDEHRDEISGVFEVDRPDAPGGFGVAGDLGTTTVAVYLVNLDTGAIVAAASGFNQQVRCGEDVISRINFAAKPGGREELHGLARSTINGLIAGAARSAGVDVMDISRATLAGNTTMTHLLLDLDPQPIRAAGYVPVVNKVRECAAGDAGLRLHPRARLLCAPAVGGFVGGDITAGLLCTPLLRGSDTVSMFIDVGTNGELVVGNREWLVTCACSAGPAFEGAGIRCGMPASEGAIERVMIDERDTVICRTVGDTAPRGLCGSGLVDLLAELFVKGYVDRQGRLTDKGGGAVVTTEWGRGFRVVAGSDCYWGRDLVITENDIANLIRTKAAVFSACALLLRNVGIASETIDAFYIAGGFGQHLEIENAVRIGLFPDLPNDKFHYLGNTSLLGAYLMLLAEKNRRLVDEIAGRMTYVELNSEPGYMNEYTAALFLPHTERKLFPSVEKLLLG